jgi:NADH-ubiquinone oxidoreductase chain 1
MACSVGCLQGCGAMWVAGWSSNSLLGGLRSVAQTISHEVSLALILMSFVFFFFICGYKLLDFYYFQCYL